MLKVISTMAAAGAFLALASSAQAITPAPIAAPDEVITVAQGCGGGWYRNAYGRCVPMRAYRAPVVVAPMVVAPPVVVCRNVRTPYGWRRVCR